MRLPTYNHNVHTVQSRVGKAIATFHVALAVAMHVAWCQCILTVIPSPSLKASIASGGTQCVASGSPVAPYLAATALKRQVEANEVVL